MQPNQQEVLIALGSNLGNRARTMLRAIAMLRRWVSDVRASDVYATTPKYFENQPMFLNMAIRGQTDLAPFELLTAMQQIEVDLGRVKAERYGPRQIDLDIIYYSDWIVAAPDLTIPHPLRAERRFVLAPLADIAGAWRDPASGLTIRAMLQRLPDDGDGCASLGSIIDGPAT